MMERCDVLPRYSAGPVAIFSLAAIAAAQGRIRLESRQVLVSTVVFDQKLCTLTDKKHHSHNLSNPIAHDAHFSDSIAIAPYRPRISICTKVAKNNGYSAGDGEKRTPRRF
jgi:hypothetical protein